MDAALAQSGLFRVLDPSTFTALTQRLQTVAFPRAHTIFTQGDPGDHLYIITAGKVKIGCKTPDGHEILITVLGPTEIFGELAVFDEGERASTVTALTDVEAVTMDRDTLSALMMDRPEIADQLLRILARRLRRTSVNLSHLILCDVPGRLAKQLLYLTQRFGCRDGDVLRLDHDLSQTELAQLVGASRATVNRTLAEFVDRGWIRLHGNTVFIRDPASLARRAN